MPRTGLTREKVIDAALALIEQSGTTDFSMRALAEYLNIKTASLYNHVDSLDVLLLEVCARALRLQQAFELSAIQGKAGDEAIAALAEAYRSFAKAHRQLYQLIMTTAVACGEQLQDVSRCMIEPFLNVLTHTSLSADELCHWQRILRAIVHGFVSQEESGFFAHLPVSVDDSFHVAIQCYLDGLRQAEMRNRL